MTRPFPLKVLLPLALGVIVSVAVLVFSEFGYRRLDVANRQSTTALEMEARLKMRKEQAGLAHRDDIKTFVDFIDADEKRI